MRKLFSEAHIDGISRRLILGLVFISSLITALITSADLYFDYKKDISGIYSRIDFIQSSYLPTLIDSVWVSDNVQIQTQLEGLSRLQDIEYLGISIDDQTKWSAGGKKFLRRIEKSIPLTRHYRGEEVNIGTLTVVASVDNVIDRLWGKLISILIRNFFKTALIALFMFGLIQALLGRHLQHIGTHLLHFGMDTRGTPPLQLHRPPTGRWRPDLLDQLSTAINDMRTRLIKAQIESENINKRLEEHVTQRTLALTEAKNEAERANNAKSEFLSRMSHELRTPLNAIIGFAQVLEAEKLETAQRDSVDEIKRAGGHLLELINDLLDLSRVESGNVALDIHPFELGVTLNGAIHLLIPAMEHRNIRCSNLCGHDHWVLADPMRLKQVLVNLLTNAVKYNREGGLITVNCETLAQGSLRLKVTDTGPGIALDQQDKLFKPFERLGAENTATEGTGIGLVLSKQLAEMMNATLGFDTTPGQGSTFWIDLPLHVPGEGPSLQA